MSKRNNLFKIEMLLLGVLKHRDYYGYELASTIREVTDDVFDVKEGVMYPILYRMLEEGYVSTREEVVNRKVRVYYHLEEKGIQYFDEMVEDYRKMCEQIEKIIKF
ncbi:PadR family transcriptional regulator [Traorella massiliensis]|uniref:PadR family transcriptional regulator n=1 Tax=Traorella massiliensis TaxID=1903263 RepID=UPI0008F90248|nr:PadR family transcriptional regulator [Traorella massiliensis]